MIGKTLGHYEITGKLGEGGMGVVWRAVDTRLDRQVAVKLMTEQLAEDENALARFEREARAVAAISHPNILALYDVGRFEGVSFAVTELLEGETLRERLRKGALSDADALDVATQVAQALGAAHDRGIVHRDLKPANVFLTRDGHIKLLDFGLAAFHPALVVEGVESEDEVTRTLLSHPGIALGTVGYMAPEQARGQGADPRADVFAFGALLYEMLSAKRAFEGATIVDTLAAVLEAPAPHVESAEIDAIVQRCLSKDADARFASGRELATALQWLASSGSRQAAAVDRSRSRTRMAFAATAVVVVVAVLGATLWMRGGKNAPATSGATLRDAIAVMPFVVNGADEYAYLSGGMVDLFSVKLDGAAGWRGIDPSAVWRTVDADGPPPDPSHAAEIATRLGASNFVLGSILEAAGRLQLNASLYDVAEVAEPIAHAATEGAADQVFDMVDDVAAQLLIGTRPGPASRIERVGGVTTESLEAFKAYLEADQYYRDGDYQKSLEAYQRSVAEDPEFALAYYRLAYVAEWTWNEEVMTSATDDALRLAHRLPDRERRLVEVFGVRMRETNSKAEEVYRGFLDTYPDDSDAWSNLGELEFHVNPLRGHPFTESREAFEQALRLDPSNTGVMLHLARMAAYEGDIESMDRIVERVFAVNPDAQRASEMRTLLAAIHNDPERKRAIAAELGEARPFAIAESVWNAAVFAKNPELGIRLCELMTEPRIPRGLRRVAYNWMSHLHAALGRWDDAQRALDELEPIDPVSAALGRARLVVLPGAPFDDEAIQRAHADLAVLEVEPPQTSAGPLALYAVDEDVKPALRVYALGILAAQLGRLDELENRADELDRFQYDGESQWLVNDLALGLRARIEQAAGSPERALALLESMSMRTWHGLTLLSPYHTRVHERHLRAELLRELGRGKEAQRWIDNIAQTSPFEVAYLRRNEVGR